MVLSVRLLPLIMRLLTPFKPVWTVNVRRVSGSLEPSPALREGSATAICPDRQTDGPVPGGRGAQPSQTPAETAVFTSFRASFLISSWLPGYSGTRTSNPHSCWLPSAGCGGDFVLTTAVIHVYQHPQQVQQQLKTQKYVNQLLINSSEASSWFLRTR